MATGVFSRGERTRIGLCSVAEQPRLRERLTAFTREFGGTVTPSHGGMMPMVRRAPVTDYIFRVGDAAGHSLPVAAEGIRTAIPLRSVCGQISAAVLRGSIPINEGGESYQIFVRRANLFHCGLLAGRPFPTASPSRFWRSSRASEPPSVALPLA